MHYQKWLQKTWIKNYQQNSHNHQLISNCTNSCRSYQTRNRRKLDWVVSIGTKRLAPVPTLET